MAGCDGRCLGGTTRVIAVADPVAGMLPPGTGATGGAGWRQVRRGTAGNTPFFS